MSAEKTVKNWFTKRAEAEAKKDFIPLNERIGNLVGAIAVLLITLYFVVHQISSTGFFTQKFGLAEAVLFYTSLLLGMILNVARSIIGRKNTVRPLDTLSSALFFIALIWLFSVFPFEFSHFTDVLPSFLRFLLRWISNDIAKIFMTLGIIASIAFTAYTAVLYVFVRRELTKSLDG